MAARAQMLVSARVDRALRDAVAAGRRPQPEFLYLEKAHGVELLDWTALRSPPALRTQVGSVRHALHAIRRAHGFDVIFSDGEHVGIPLALAMRALGMRQPHVMLGHHLTRPHKRPFFRYLHADRGITRVLVHSVQQAEMAAANLGISPRTLAVVPYCVDTGFWTPGGPAEPDLVVTAGREHRDYATLAAACDGLPVRVEVAAGSLHSPAATWTVPKRWPANFTIRPMGYEALRERYRLAAVVVVPVLETDFQAGITTVLEAMACGRPVVVSATRGRAEAIEDGINGLLVPPGDASALRGAVRRLLADRRERERLGANARSTVAERFRVDLFGDRLAAHLDQAAAAGLSAARMQAS